MSFTLLQIFEKLPIDEQASANDLESALISIGASNENPNANDNETKAVCNTGKIYYLFLNMYLFFSLYVFFCIRTRLPRDVVIPGTTMRGYLSTG